MANTNEDDDAAADKDASDTGAGYNGAQLPSTQAAAIEKSKDAASKTAESGADQNEDESSDSSSE